MKRFLKRMLNAGISYGLAWGVLMYFSIWSKKGIPASFCVLMSIFAGLWFGLFMAIFFHFSERFAWKRMGKNSNDIGVNQKKEFTLAISQAEAFKKAKEKLPLLRVKIKSFDEGEGIIIAKTGMSWKSFGEILTLTIKKDNETNVRIKIESNPALKTTMVDYGKNLQNVEKFYSLMISD